MSIYIFSRPVHSGKTTELVQWCSQQKSIAGILMPDIEGSRKILDLYTKEVFDIECTEVANTKERLTSVGRFHFYTAAFDKANAIVLAALSRAPDWLAIDEVGKLELEGKGFYESIVKSVELYNDGQFAGNLLFTVRESLFSEVVLFFNMKDIHVIHHLEDLMQTDKKNSR